MNPQAQAELANLALQLGHNPKTRRGMAQLVQQINPQWANRVFRDVNDQDRIEALERRVDEKLDLAGAKAAAGAREIQKSNLKSRYTDSQIGEIEKVMGEYGISDYDAGSILYAARNPALFNPDLQPPPPDKRPGANWEFPTVPGQDGKLMSFDDFAKDPKAASINAAYQMITDFKARKLPAAFHR